MADLGWDRQDERLAKALGYEDAKILKLTGKTKFGDGYFTQTLLPDFRNDNPELTANWKVAYDARGHFVEPHTRYEIGLGTIEVQNHVATEAKKGPAISFVREPMYPTRGPLNRYHTILFIEKEGFMPLLEAAQIEKRFDVGIMSTKGMSVTAARAMLDELSQSPHLKKVLVAHDFDAYGFSIFGTLGSSGRRYKFKNEVPIIDIGFRWDDIQGIDPEPYEVEDWDKRVQTLRRHGATEQEIAFLQTRRVELNAMTAPEFVAFLEAKLVIHAQKVVPAKAVIEEHARRIWEQQEAEARCKTILETIHAEAANVTLPGDLVGQVIKRLKEEPALCWDLAVAAITIGKREC
jgi:hypothetical protein